MRLLVANFFPAFHPPRSGGEQRYYWLYHHLSRHYDVTLLSPTYSTHPPEVVTYSPTFREHRVPKDHVYDRLHWQLDAAGIGPECSGYVVALAGGAETAYGRRFAELVAHHDVVVHECPFTLPYDRTLGLDGKPRVYNAYNVESRLFAQMLRGDAGRAAVDLIRFLEGALAASAALVLATCEEERQAFVAEFGVAPARTRVVPNGFEPAVGEAAVPAPPAAGARPSVVFMGSAHPPNVEAAVFIAERLAPALPDVDFRIVGTVCERLPATTPPNVVRDGFLAEADKQRLLAGCAAALNPLSTGAGTNLKMLDYMAAGLPIVTTPVGARGLALTDGVDAYVRDPDACAEALRAVLRDPDAARAVGGAARRKALRDYTWAEIAERVHDALEATLRPGAGTGTPARPTLLVVNDFPVARAENGGQVRIRELLTELAHEYEVVLLCLTADARRTERAIAPGFTELAVPKTAEHRAAEAAARAGARVSVDDLIAAEQCLRNAELVAAFRERAVRAAAVVFEHPYLAPLLDALPDTTPVVYSSLNVESDLKAETLRPRADAEARVAQAAALESRLLARADLIVCVSDADRARFEQERPDGRYVVIASGARLDGREPSVNGLFGHRPFAVFLGSGHPPNVTAAEFLVRTMAPALPEVTFGLVGSVCGAVEAAPWPRNVLRLGVVGDEEKTVLLAHATLAVNPLFEGGGSSLKIPDFFAAGLPVVSTAVGVRGYPLREGEHYLAADRDTFVAATRRLAEDVALRRRLAANVRTFCERELDWRLLGARYRRALRALVAPDAGPRVLVATYRFADPPPGGAEAFLANALAALDRRGRLRVDVATCDVGTIANQWHFSARYDAPPEPPASPPYVRAVHRFPVDPPRVGDFATCARLFSLWMRESRDQAARLAATLDPPLLLGGWNYPEDYGGAPARWTSRRADLLVGAGATGLRLVGVPPQQTRVEVLRDGTPVASRVVAERFEWALDLPPGGPIVSLRVAHAFVARDDPRELGILVPAVSVRGARGAWTPCDLAIDVDTAARRRDPDGWVRSLMDVAVARDPDEDARFVEVRGPRSRAFRRWLADHVASYDVVLAQGVPFATPVDVADVAARRGVPVVVLPHFHMEDRYYHWRRYYDAFRQARCVIASSPRVKRVVLDALGATSVALPGGGVDPAEYGGDGAEARRRAFRALHPSRTPFVLVLGRKVGSKNYQTAVDAVAALNRDGHRVDVVLIGPDEDGVPIDVPHCRAYGAQPREVVLGALAEACCLVNMSESESFGIVLLESWLSGRPVVAQRHCLAFADLVVPGENGFLAASVAEAAAAIRAYLDDPALAARHAERGRALAEGYSWAHLAEGIERVLVEAAASPQPAAGACHV